MPNPHAAAAAAAAGPVISGIRSTCELLIYADVAAAMAQGIAFYRSANGVILVDSLPVAFFLRVEDLTQGGALLSSVDSIAISLAAMSASSDNVDELLKSMHSTASNYASELSYDRTPPSIRNQWAAAAGASGHSSTCEPMAPLSWVRYSSPTSPSLPIANGCSSERRQSQTDMTPPHSQMQHLQYQQRAQHHSTAAAVIAAAEERAARAEAAPLQLQVQASEERQRSSDAAIAAAAALTDAQTEARHL
eukprot:2039-Heterococcus_DN1.PRE.1